VLEIKSLEIDAARAALMLLDNYPMLEKLFQEAKQQVILNNHRRRAWHENLKNAH